MVRLLALTTIVVLAYRARQDGVDLMDVKGLVFKMLQDSAARLSYVADFLRVQAGALLKQ